MDPTPPDRSATAVSSITRHAAISTVSHWGLAVMTLLLLTGAKVACGRERTVGQS